MPCLHDKVLAAASDAAFSVSLNQKKHVQVRDICLYISYFSWTVYGFVCLLSSQSTAPGGLFGGLIQGLKGGKPDHRVEHNETRENVIAHLESIFSRVPFSDLSTSIDIDIDMDLSTSIPDEKEVVELDIGFTTFFTHFHSLPSRPVNWSDYLNIYVYIYIFNLGGLISKNSNHLTPQEGTFVNRLKEGCLFNRI